MSNHSTFVLIFQTDKILTNFCLFLVYLFSVNVSDLEIHSKQISSSLSLARTRRTNPNLCDLQLYKGFTFSAIGFLILRHELESRPTIRLSIRSMAHQLFQRGSPVSNETYEIQVEHDQEGCKKKEAIFCV